MRDFQLYAAVGLPPGNSQKFKRHKTKGSFRILEYFNKAKAEILHLKSDSDLSALLKLRRS